MSSNSEFKKFIHIFPSDLYRNLTLSTLTSLPLVAFEHYSLIAPVFIGNLFERSYAGPSKKVWNNFLREKHIESQPDTKVSLTGLAISTVAAGLLAYVNVKNPEVMSVVSGEEPLTPSFIAQKLGLLSLYKNALTLGYLQKNSLSKVLNKIWSYPKQFFREGNFFFGINSKQHTSILEENHSQGYFSLDSLISDYLNKGKETKALSLIMSNYLLSNDAPKSEYDQINHLIKKRVMLLPSCAESFSLISYFGLDEKDDLLTYYANQGIREARKNDDLQQLALFSLYLYQQDAKIGKPLLEEVAKKISSHSLDEVVLGEGASGGVKTLHFNDALDEEPVSLLLVQKENDDLKKLTIKEEYDLTKNASLDNSCELLFADVLLYNQTEENEFMMELRYNEPTLRDFSLEHNAVDLYTEVYRTLPIVEEVIGCDQQQVNFYTKYGEELFDVIDLYWKTSSSFVALTDSIDKNFLVSSNKKLRRIDLTKKGMGSRMSELVNIVDHSFDVVETSDLRTSLLNQYQQEYNVDDEQLALHYLSALRLRLESFRTAWQKPGRNSDLVRLASFEKHCYTIFEEYGALGVAEITSFSKAQMSHLVDY